MESATAHPLTRALRVDKLTLAALQGPATLTAQALPPTRAHCSGEQRPSRGGCGGSGVAGGGAPGVTLDSAAVSLPECFATPLRAASPPVLARIERGRCLLDLRALPAEQDAAVRDAVLACLPAFMS